MSQEDLEKAYTEAVDQLARAVEANRLLTERLEKQELLLGDVRGDCHSVIHHDRETGGQCHDCGDYAEGFNAGMAEQAADTLAILDARPAPSQDK